MRHSRFRGGVKGLFGRTRDDEPEEYLDSPYESVPQHQTLQLLTLAQRTAEEYIAVARRDADAICGDAQTKAGQVIQEATTRVRVLQEHAEKTLSDAHATAAEIAREAQANANNVRRNAEEVLSEARARAEEIAKAAHASADELMNQAQLRYEEMVGGLAGKRDDLQRQIDALKQFDQEYRTRLTGILQGLLRALWTDEPRVAGDGVEPADVLATIGSPPAPEYASASRRKVL